MKTNNSLAPSRYKLKKYVFVVMAVFKINKIFYLQKEKAQESERFIVIEIDNMDNYMNRLLKHLCGTWNIETDVSTLKMG